MTNVALVDVDNSEKIQFPNLVLMKASTYYKNKGYNVKLIHGKKLDRYDKEFDKKELGKEHITFCPDIVIKSKVFTWTKNKEIYCKNKNSYQFGGTGSPDITLKIRPEIDMGFPDYNLYAGKYRQHSKQLENAGIGFITRGCPRNCDFCFVPEKEGKIKKYMSIEDFKNEKSDKLILLDNNILAHRHGIEEIRRMKDKELRVDFNQGLDPYIISRSEKIAELLSGLNWINQIRLACDEQKDKEALKEAVRLLRKYNCRARFFAYTIIMTNVEESYNRIKFVDSLNVIPYAQSLRDKENNPPTVYMQALQRWVSSAIGGGFYAFSFEDYLNNILVYDKDKEKFKEVRNRSEITKNWKLKHKGMKKEKRKMDLGKKTIKEMVDRKIKGDNRCK